MYKFHKDKARYFNIQRQVTGEYIYPFLADQIRLEKKLHVLEIGCAEAGVLKYFLEKGHKCMGIELSPSRVDLAKGFLLDEIRDKQASIINKNIFNIEMGKDIKMPFDLIILKDVIEHIPDKDVFFVKVKEFLSDEGLIFFAFPPWRMPFGGHQQICTNKFLNKLPWIHLLPRVIYKSILKIFGEKESTIQELMELTETRLSINSFHKYMKNHGFRLKKENYWLVNPIYKYKFGLKPRQARKKPGLLGDFYISCLYSLVSVNP